MPAFTATLCFLFVLPLYTDNGGLAVYQLLESRKRNYRDALPRNRGLGGLSAGTGRHGASA